VIIFPHSPQICLIFILVFNHAGLSILILVGESFPRISHCTYSEIPLATIAFFQKKGIFLYATGTSLNFIILASISPLLCLYQNSFLSLLNFFK